VLLRSDGKCLDRLLWDTRVGPWRESEFFVQSLSPLFLRSQKKTELDLTSISQAVVGMALAT
jgi:hypothetical protein